MESDSFPSLNDYNFFKFSIQHLNLSQVYTPIIKGDICDNLTLDKMNLKKYRKVNKRYKSLKGIVYLEINFSPSIR